MSTRSGIGIYHKGNIHGIYSHSDGYVDYVGYVLHNFYQNPEKILALVAQGDVSMLGMDIGYKVDFNDRLQYVRIQDGSEDGKRVAQQCRFYARDRGEKTPPQVYGSEYEFTSSIDGEYFYLYKDDQWFVDAGQGFTPVADYFKTTEEA
jgi:glycosyltransferase involved in cell wall biosynthesis